MELEEEQHFLVISVLVLTAQTQQINLLKQVFLLLLSEKIQIYQVIIALLAFHLILLGQIKQMQIMSVYS